MEVEKDKWVEIDRKGDVGTFVYAPSNYPGPIAIDATMDWGSNQDQPERSKRKDIDKMVKEYLEKAYQPNGSYDRFLENLSTAEIDQH